MDDRPIGVFDSGLGGLTVVKELNRLLPEESIVYFGDTARVPYGTRSRDTVMKYSEQCIRFLLSKDIKMVIVACNTVSATSLEALKKKFDIPILGVIEPGALAAVKATRNKRVGVIGTGGTIKSGAYPAAIKRLDPGISVFEKACPLFVPIVEEGWSGTEVAQLTAREYLAGIKDSGVDTLVLGCTHYPLLSGVISEVMGPDVRLVNPAEGTAARAREILMAEGLKRESKAPASTGFYVSDIGERFQTIGGHFLNKDINAEYIEIEKY